MKLRQYSTQNGVDYNFIQEFETEWWWELRGDGRVWYSANRGENWVSSPLTKEDAVKEGAETYYEIVGMTMKECYQELISRDKEAIAVQDTREPNWVYIVHWNSKVEICRLLGHYKTSSSVSNFEYGGNAFKILPDKALDYLYAVYDVYDTMTMCPDYSPNYISGYQIKKLFTDIVKAGKEVFGDAVPELYVNFYDKYIVSEHPLSNRTMYCLRRLNYDLDDCEIKAYKEK